MLSIVLYFIIFTLTISVNGFGDWSNDMKADKWHKDAEETLNRILKRKANHNVAKNIILLMGDGMGLSTITAGRIFKGQLKNQSGEELVTNMERLDSVGLVKTYNIDAQTSDSAGTATAFLSGVKTRISVVGVDGRAVYDDCKSSLNAKLENILHWAHRAGKSVGVVTTTRLTHATPAATYAGSPNRYWEAYDDYNFGKKQADQGCKDIAAQFLEYGNFINVFFAGGRKNFMRKQDKDPVNDKKFGVRTDNRTLLREWDELMNKTNKSHILLTTVQEFRNFDIDKYDHVLGLLAHDHMEYEYLRNNSNEPSLIEMTEKAIKILSRNKNGYFLFVEGGKIDVAHHASNAFHALNEFVVFDDAVGKAIEMTSENDTLLTVTADHSHTFTLGGYALRGNNILGLAYNIWKNTSDANLTYTSLTYANGPGGILALRRRNLTDEQVANPNYVQESAIYLTEETHGGEDVSIYARGPMSFLYQDTIEQNYIAHVMAYAACIGRYNTSECVKNRGYMTTITITPPPVVQLMPNTSPKMSLSMLILPFILHALVL